MRENCPNPVVMSAVRPVGLTPSRRRPLDSSIDILDSAAGPVNEMGEMLDRADDATPAPRMSPPRFTEPTRPCPRCGAVARLHRYEAATLRMLGWPPMGEASWVNWCGHAQRVRFEPDGDDWFREVLILEEAG